MPGIIKVTGPDADAMGAALLRAVAACAGKQVVVGEGSLHHSHRAFAPNEMSRRYALADIQRRGAAEWLSEEARMICAQALEEPAVDQDPRADTQGCSVRQPHADVTKRPQIAASPSSSTGCGGWKEKERTAMDTFTTGPGASKTGALGRHLARLREPDMNKFSITRADLETMDLIARVSSRSPDLPRWTELALYYRPGATRPFVAVVEGHSEHDDEKLRFQYAVMGTLDRAMNWFDGSQLRERLAAEIPADHAVLYPTGGKAPRALRTDPSKLDYSLDMDAINVETRYDSRFIQQRIGHLQAQILDTANEQVRASLIAMGWTPPAGEGLRDKVSAMIHPAAPAARYTGPDRLTEALQWLYPDAKSDAARALAFERDFGMPGRTTRNTLAIEAGRVQGNPGPWVQAIVTALRHFDRAAWETGRG